MHHIRTNLDKHNIWDRFYRNYTKIHIVFRNTWRNYMKREDKNHMRCVHFSFQNTENDAQKPWFDTVSVEDQN